MKQHVRSMSSLSNKNILVGITGGIAAYKSADLVRRLREAGARIRVTMTENAKRFITPLTLQALSGFPVHDDLFDLHAEAAMGHIELARWADLIVVAPATADFMARLVYGQANDLLTTICLAAKAQIVIAPAMNQFMWKNKVTQANLQHLLAKNIAVLGPDTGSQACGDTGPGRMLEPADIVSQLNALFHINILSGQRVMITAGPTQEAIDPVRFVSNHSSGKMGYTLAQAAYEAGAKVTLISGPVELAQPHGVIMHKITSAMEMYTAVMKEISEYDIFISVAAISDYRSSNIAAQKIHKDADEITVNLIRNPDIISAVSKLPDKPYIVGFAAETEDVIARAKRKKQAKNMDMIIANDVSAGKSMGKDENEVTVIWNESAKFFSMMPKRKLAREIIKLIANRMQQ